MPGVFRNRRADGLPTKRALSIGITYENCEAGPDTLLGTHHDCERVKALLTSFYGYKTEDITILMDDGVHKAPTCKNILAEFDNLVADAIPGDRFVFHFSGHGGQVPNDDEEDYEEDGMDETIWPVDVKYDSNKEDAIANFIKDDDIRKRLVNKLPEGTHLTIILDNCHSGTGADLPNTHSVDDEELVRLWSPVSPQKSPFSQRRRTRGGDGPSMPLQAGGLVEATASEIGKMVDDSSTKSVARVRQPRSWSMDQSRKNDKHVTSWAACIDSELGIESPNGGLLVQAFDKILRNNRSLTHEELLKAIAKELVLKLRPAKPVWKELGLELNRPRPVFSSLQSINDVLHMPFAL